MSPAGGASRSRRRSEAVCGDRGPSPTRQFLIVLDGRPAGMIQTYLVTDHPEWQQLVQVDDDVAGVDLLIGEPDLVGHGLGPRILAAFTRDVVFVDPAVNAVVATVEESNRRSWRAFEKAGFWYVLDVEEDGLPHRLMRLDRPACKGAARRLLGCIRGSVREVNRL